MQILTLNLADTQILRRFLPILAKFAHIFWVSTNLMMYGFWDTRFFSVLWVWVCIPFTLIYPWGGKPSLYLWANEPFQRMRGQKWPHVSCNSLLLFGLLLKSLVSNSIWHTRPSWLIRRCLGTSCAHKSHTNHIQAPLLCERRKNKNNQRE